MLTAFLSTVCEVGLVVVYEAYLVERLQVPKQTCSSSKNLRGIVSAGRLKLILTEQAKNASMAQ